VLRIGNVAGALVRIAVTAATLPLAMGFGTARPNLPSAPPNDNFANAVVVTGESGSVAGTNVGATMEPGEPQHYPSGGRSVWYSWTPPVTGLATWTVVGDFDAIYAVYTGSAVDALTRVSGADFHDRTASFGVLAGTTYHVAVDGYGTAGNFTLSWSMYTGGPPNDVYAAATQLEGNQGTVIGPNFGASRESY